MTSGVRMSRIVKAHSTLPQSWRRARCGREWGVARSAGNIISSSSSSSGSRKRHASGRSAPSTDPLSPRRPRTCTEGERQAAMWGSVARTRLAAGM